MFNILGFPFPPTEKESGGSGDENEILPEMFAGDTDEKQMCDNAHFNRVSDLTTRLDGNGNKVFKKRGDDAKKVRSWRDDRGWEARKDSEATRILHSSAKSEIQVRVLNSNDNLDRGCTHVLTLLLS